MNEVPPGGLTEPPESVAVRAEMLLLVNNAITEARAMADGAIAKQMRASTDAAIRYVALSEEEQRELREALAARFLRRMLAETHRDVIDDDQFPEYYELVEHRPPFAVVRRKADGQLGSLTFASDLRTYFCFTPDQGDLHHEEEA
jgi:hypothetical protein